MKDIRDVSAAALYKKLKDNRQPFETRAQDASKLTMPQLYPEIDSTSTTTYPTPYQSLGARGVNNLANKIILSLFPPATAFFKLGVAPMKTKEAGVSDGDVQTAMYAVEKSVVNEMEVSQLRSVLVDVIKQGIVGGSSILYVPDKDKPSCYSLKQFGVKRSKSGKVIKMVIEEDVNYLELDDDVKGQLSDLEDAELNGDKDLKLYTLVLLMEDGMYHSIQEIKGVKIDSTEASYKENECPYIFVPFVDRGEDYGRSYVEDFIGDLKSYEGLRQAILEASSEAARLIYLVKPNAVITPRKLEKAKSGDVLLGSADDVSVLQADKRLDVQMAQTEAETLRIDLSTIFLLDSAVRRDAERVTAEEIRRVSQELEVALGGIYSTLANVVQEPLVRIYLRRLVKKKILNDVIKNNVDMEVTTGSAALGRGTEFRALQSFMAVGKELLGEQFGNYMNVSEALSRLAYSLDVNTGELVKTKEQLAAEQQAANTQALQERAVGPAVQAASRQQELEQGN